MFVRAAAIGFGTRLPEPTSAWRRSTARAFPQVTQLVNVGNLGVNERRDYRLARQFLATC